MVEGIVQLCNDTTAPNLLCLSVYTVQSFKFQMANIEEITFANGDCPKEEKHRNSFKKQR